MDAGPPQPAGVTPRPPSALRAVAVYTGLRVALFAGVAVVLYAAGLRRVLLVLAALLLSGVLAVLLLPGQRVAMVDAVLARFRQLNRRIDERAAAEDEVAERLYRQQQVSGGERDAPPAAAPPAADPPTPPAAEPGDRS